MAPQQSQQQPLFSARQLSPGGAGQLVDRRHSPITAALGGSVERRHSPLLAAALGGSGGSDLFFGDTTLADLLAASGGGGGGLGGGGGGGGFGGRLSSSGGGPGGGLALAPGLAGAEAGQYSRGDRRPLTPPAGAPGAVGDLWQDSTGGYSENDEVALSSEVRGMGGKAVRQKGGQQGNRVWAAR